MLSNQEVVLLGELRKNELLQKYEHQANRKPRLAQFRSELEFDSPDFEPDLRRICRGFLDWTRYPEYMVFKKQHKFTDQIKFKAVLASKRGNKVYAYRQRQKFKALDNIPDTEFFNYRDRGKRHKTRALFITLLYNANELTISDAWKQVGSDWNRFITGLRKRFGSIKALRVWESHESGYPHIHAILIFESQDFEAFHLNAHWRVSGKDNLVKDWSHGFSDVEALASTHGGIKYVTKYMTKLNEVGVHGQARDAGEPYQEASMAKVVTNATVLTLALMWVFRKRAYSVSGGFLEAITGMHNSNQVRGQVDLINLESVWEWTLMGFWGGNLGVWGVDLDFSRYRELQSSPTWTDNVHLNS